MHKEDKEEALTRSCCQAGQRAGLCVQQQAILNWLPNARSLYSCCLILRADQQMTRAAKSISDRYAQYMHLSRLGSRPPTSSSISASASQSQATCDFRQYTGSCDKGARRTTQQQQQLLLTADTPQTMTTGDAGLLKALACLPSAYMHTASACGSTQRICVAAHLK
jgi:hypothetical protein